LRAVLVVVTVVVPVILSVNKGASIYKEPPLPSVELIVVKVVVPLITITIGFV